MPLCFPPSCMSFALDLGPDAHLDDTAEYACSDDCGSDTETEEDWLYDVQPHEHGAAASLGWSEGFVWRVYQSASAAVNMICVRHRLHARTSHCMLHTDASALHALILC